MEDVYRISARIQPFKPEDVSNILDGARLGEARLLVPMRGSQSIGELFIKIERIYADLYDKAM